MFRMKPVPESCQVYHKNQIATGFIKYSAVLAQLITRHYHSIISNWNI